MRPGQQPITFSFSSLFRFKCPSSEGSIFENFRFASYRDAKPSAEWSQVDSAPAGPKGDGSVSVPAPVCSASLEFASEQTSVHHGQQQAPIHIRPQTDLFVFTGNEPSKSSASGESEQSSERLAVPLTVHQQWQAGQEALQVQAVLLAVRAHVCGRPPDHCGHVDLWLLSHLQTVSSTLSS